jgi:glycogen(starch) synthase
MLVANNFVNDSRVEREASTLGENGFDVSVVAVSRMGLPDFENKTNYKVYRLNATGPVFFIVLSFVLKVFRAGRKSIIKIFNGNTEPDLLDENTEHLSKRWIFFKKMNLRYKALLNFLFAYSSMRGFAKASLKKLRELKPDVVHIHDFNAAIGAIQFCKETKTPYVYDSHELWLERNRGKIKPLQLAVNWERNLEKNIVTKAKAVITVCNSIAKSLEKTYGLNSVSVLRNLPPFQEQVRFEKFSIKNQLGIAEDQFVFVYTGLITHSRGIEVILKALSQLDSRAVLVFIGYYANGYEEYVNQLIAMNKLEGRVFHFGPVPSAEVSNYVSFFDVALVPIEAKSLSYHFALPNKLFEAIMAGIPVIGSNLPEIQQVISEYSCGLVFDTELELKAAMQRMMTDPLLLKKLREATSVAKQKLNWDYEHEILLDIYRPEAEI